MGKTPHGMGKSVFLLVLKIMGKSVIGTSEMGKSVWAKTCGQKFDGQNSVNPKQVAKEMGSVSGSGWSHEKCGYSFHLHHQRVLPGWVG